MKIRHLKIFKAVCEAKSITQAASNLYISQPAVSAAIKELETVLDLQLFDRISGKIYLNKNGKIFLSKVEEILSLYDNLVEDTLDQANDTPLTIGSSITIAYDILSSVINQFERQYPDTTVKVIVKNANEIEQMVANNELDFGLVEGVITNQSLAYELISSYELLVLCGQQHKFSNQNPVRLKDLVLEQFLLREKGSAIREQFDSVMRINNLKVEPLWTSINSQVLVQGAINNIGLTILPKTIVTQELKQKQLIQVNVSDQSFINNNYIIYHPSKQFDERSTHLREIINSQSNII